MTDELGFTTRALRNDLDEVRQRPLAPPIYQTATFAFDDIEEFAAVGKTKLTGGYLYSRWANPTVDVLARTIASLEGAEATACSASGMGAIHVTLSSLLRAGDHAVAARPLYGGSHNIFAHMLPRMGVDATFADAVDPGSIDAAFTDRTTVLFAETIGNPTLTVTDLDALAAIAHERGATFVVDATFTPPSILRPLEHGADVSIHSATKYLGGHSDITAGVASGSRQLIEQIRLHQIDSGAVLAPFEAWLIQRSLGTLALRTDRICANALTLARALSEHPGVGRVHYPGLEGHPQHELARRLMGDRFGGMVSFDVSGGLEAGRRFLERVRIASPAASLGGTKTLVVHPASVTHTQLGREEREALGVTDGLIRMSVGIEDPEDLIDDLGAALS